MSRYVNMPYIFFYSTDRLIALWYFKNDISYNFPGNEINFAANVGQDGKLHIINYPTNTEIVKFCYYENLCI